MDFILLGVAAVIALIWLAVVVLVYDVAGKVDDFLEYLRSIDDRVQRLEEDAKRGRD